MAEDRRAAQADKEAARAAKSAAALAAWRIKVNWKPRDPSKPRKQKPKRPRRQQQQQADANGNAAVPAPGLAPGQPLAAAGTADPAMPAGVYQQQQLDAADGPAAAPPAAAKPKGIQIKLAAKSISIVRAAVPKKPVIVEESGPVSPTAASVEGKHSIAWSSCRPCTQMHDLC